MEAILASWTVCVPSFGWEVVQLVGLQTLDLAILVRVQASQPNFKESEEGVGPISSFFSG